MKKVYLAVDIGASSGRFIAGWRRGGQLVTKEIHRFPVAPSELNGRIVWDVPKLWENILEGVAMSFSKYHNIECMSVAVWGVDYVLMDGEREIPPYYSYRDTYVLPLMDKLHQIVPFEEMYERTGIQRQAFNTVYRLYDDMLTGRLEKATSFMMLPEYFAYKLTGVYMPEYTNATTTGLINVHTGQYDMDIIRRLGLPERFFGHVYPPGTHVGTLTDQITTRVRGRSNVCLCASHDTASAYESVDTDEHSPFLSSGTWSLLGIKLKKPLITPAGMKANFTNEGGVGYIRFLKNITGLWILRRLQDEYRFTYDTMEWLAAGNNYEGTFDVNDPAFNAPPVMSQAIIAKLAELGEPAPSSPADVINSAYLSLAQSYKRAIDELQSITGEEYTKLYIVGGGARDRYLNTLTARATGKEIIAIPVEATAVGNLRVQMRAEDPSA
jgi:rhamnulokinase